MFASASLSLIYNVLTLCHNNIIIYRSVIPLHSFNSIQIYLYSAFTESAFQKCTWKKNLSYHDLRLHFFGNTLLSCHCYSAIIYLSSVQYYLTTCTYYRVRIWSRANLYAYHLLLLLWLSACNICKKDTVKSSVTWFNI